MVGYFAADRVLRFVKRKDLAPKRSGDGDESWVDLNLLFYNLLLKIGFNLSLNVGQDAILSHEFSSGANWPRSVLKVLRRRSICSEFVLFSVLNSAMSRQIRHFYDFDRFRLDATERALFCDGEMMTLTQKALEVLLVLVELRGRIVEKDELMKRVWPDSFVEESNLTHQIYTLRKALGKASDEKEYIQTIPRRGYRFVAEVSETRNEAGKADYPVTVEEFATADATAGVNIREVEPEPKPDASSFGNNLIRSRAKPVALACLLLVIVAGAAFWWIKARPFESPSTRSARAMTITNLTTTGNLSCVAVSPDGRSPISRGELLARWSLHLLRLAGKRALAPHAPSRLVAGRPIEKAARKRQFPRLFLARRGAVCF